MGITELWIKFHIIIIDYQMFMYQMNANVLAICINNCQRHLLTLSWVALKGQSVDSVVSVINDSDFFTFLLWPLSKILFFWKKIMKFDIYCGWVAFFLNYIFKNLQKYSWIILLASCTTLVSSNKALGLHVDWLLDIEVVSFLLCSSLLASVLRAGYLFLKPRITYMYQVVRRILYIRWI